MKPGTANTVLDAGELSGEPQHVLGFAIGLLEMLRDHVPVADAIRMARQLGRPVNLRWSPKRWKAEHGRLSHLVTLEKLRADNVVYDLSEFEKHLPDKWPGYLVRSSRRLGLEGYRQQHCVASYHRSIQRGYCAIATVFVNRARWTVQLHRHSYSETPWITQIAGRRNRRPSAEITQAIHEAMGLEGRQNGSNNPQDHRYMENLRLILPVLREMGATSARAFFSGYGDSGQIDDVVIEPSELHPVSLLRNVESRRVEAARTDDGWRKEEVVEVVTLDDAIRALTDDYLEETGVNYYDNAGGSGCLEIVVENGTVDLEVNQTVETSELAFGRVTDIDTGEVLEDRAVD